MELHSSSLKCLWNIPLTHWLITPSAVAQKGIIPCFQQTSEIQLCTNPVSPAFQAVRENSSASFLLYFLLGRGLDMHVFLKECFFSLQIKIYTNTSHNGFGVYNCNGRGKTTSYLKFLFWIVSCSSGMKRQGEHFFSEVHCLKDLLWLTLFEPAELQKEDQRAQGWCLCFWAPSTEAKLHQDWILHIACVAYFHRICAFCAGRSFLL